MSWRRLGWLIRTVAMWNMLYADVDPRQERGLALWFLRTLETKQRGRAESVVRSWPAWRYYEPREPVEEPGRRARRL